MNLNIEKSTEKYQTFEFDFLQVVSLKKNEAQCDRTVDTCYNTDGSEH